MRSRYGMLALFILVGGAVAAMAFYEAPKPMPVPNDGLDPLLRPATPIKQRIQPPAEKVRLYTEADVRGWVAWLKDNLVTTYEVRIYPSGVPSPQYLEHPPQYIPLPPDFPLAEKFATADPAEATPNRGNYCGNAAPNNVTPPAPSLPVAQAVLFSSGVGYFQREGVVNGTARVDLTFPVRDINDLLKSMVVRDLDGGHVGAVSYDSNAPVEKTLNSFAINLTGNPSLAAILNQARGEKVEAVSQTAGTYTGTVVGIETKKHAGKDGTVDEEVLNLACADGLHALKMDDVSRVRFLNPVMDSEFHKALETLARSHDTEKKAVSVNFVGDGVRNVRVGYVVENPVWKTSYRLVLGKEKPYLQGWAVVENVSDEDWKDVRVSLVSGRPVSFKMDLYQPLFVPRPTVQPEMFASMQPPTYGSSVGGKMFGSGIDGVRTSTDQLGTFQTGVGGRFSTPGSTQNTINYVPPAPCPPPIGHRLVTPQPTGGCAGVPFETTYANQNLRLQNGVASVAQAEKLGDFYQYVIQHPVTLPRQKSAMLPIVGKEIEARRVSIFNANTLAQHPMLGVRMKNTSGLHLMQGPITVFDNNTYAGDARILDLQPNEERLVSYAIDLGTAVEATASPSNGRFTFMKLNKGVFESKIRIRESKTYRVKNNSEEERLVVVEHPYRANFTLVSKDKPIERTRAAYRFEVKVPAGKSAVLDVSEERDEVQAVQLTNTDEQSIRLIIASPASSASLKSVLQKAVELRNAQMKTQREYTNVAQRLARINEDQARLCANLKEMPATAAAYKRYLDKFDQQETEIEKLQAQAGVLQTKEADQRLAFETYLIGLNVESPVEGIVPVGQP